MSGKRVTVIGLGAMGLPMARTLEAVGFAVTGFDASPERRSLLSGASSSFPAALEPLRAGDTVLFSLPNDHVVREVAGQLDVPEGVVVVDTSTIAPETARAVRETLAARGVGYVDAPVSGGAQGAAAGTLLVMVGGEAGEIDLAAPVLDALARLVVRCGGPGAGATVKLINNLLCAGHLLLAGEALRVADAGGVDPQTLLDALNAGSGRSAVSEVNLPKWVLSGAFDSGFTMGLMAKDVKLAEALTGAGALAGMVAAAWADAAEQLGAQEDFNRIATIPERRP